MAWLTDTQKYDILDHITSDEVVLKKKYKSRRSEYDECSVAINEINDWESEGWEVQSRGIGKRRAKIQKRKPIWRFFEDNMWCLFYELGFRKMNTDQKLVIKWGEGEGDHQQIDVLAVNDEAIFVVECKAAETSKKAPSFKKEIDHIEQTREGMVKALHELFGKKKVKFIFATKNLRFKENSEDIRRLETKKIYHFNDSTYQYIKKLITNYKKSVIYQFFGLMFKNEKINNTPVRIPALKGSMGGKTYYMMSVEPDILLRIGFVLHRTKVNESMSPTYQRMLIPSRLKDIGRFIDNNGYFPNSIIINFDEGSKVRFESAGKTSNDSDSRFGTLIIPNAYGIAHIIDGQHRVYGYAGSKYRFSNSIPVVAFYGMESREQLQIFSDINENQKAVKPALKYDLKIDLDWDAPRLDSRIGALRCAVIKDLTRDANGVLFNRIAVGEDSGDLSLKAFNDGLSKSSLLPSATYKSYKEENRDVCLYDCNLTDYNQAMTESKKRVVTFLKNAYEFMQQKLSNTLYEELISSNRGSYAFIVLLGNLNKHLIRNGKLSQKASSAKQMEILEPYLTSFSDSLSSLSQEEYSLLIKQQGQGAETLWMRKFQAMINKTYPEFIPDGLIQWLETQDKNIQEEGKKVAQEIIAILHKRVIAKIQELYGDRWESAISDVRARCKNRINDKEAKDENFDTENADWVDFMEFSDIESIINSKWNDNFEDDPSAISFEQEFAINIGGSFKTKKDKLRWLTELSTFRDSWEKPKANPINRTQVEALKTVLSSLHTD